MRMSSRQRATSPPSSSSSPVMTRSCVVLPAPFSPTRPTRSPALTSQDTSDSTSLFLKVLRTLTSLMPDEGRLTVGAVELFFA